MVAILEEETGGQNVWVNGYSWSGTGEERDVKKFGINNVCGNRIRAFDEEIGRMVVQHRTFGDTTIFDVV
jgi:hypothetical protein